MSRKRVALSVLTLRRRRQQQKRRRYNDDIHDKDVENQQPSPHPMPPIIFFAPNTFQPVSHIGVLNNTSSTVINFTNVVYSMRSYPKTQVLSLKVFYHCIYIHCAKAQALSLKGFYGYISVHCPETQAFSL